jgi:2-keto-4-pentenoate hydratase/2-oxohepta-3-ene-1,7-dioic acid hydratase in catechol pathway
MIFGVAEIVAYLSTLMTLEPGDIIATGTPPGVGMGHKPPRFLKDGDEMVLRITGLGEQHVRVQAGG